MIATYHPFKLEASWERVLEEELNKPYLIKLAAFLAEERAKGLEVYPPEELVFNALQLTPFDKVKVVIVGQDPYHGPGQAHGLSFSVPEGIRPPPSLVNIYKELSSDLNIPPSKSGSLISWAEQGVLLLNATLTVQRQNPLSHHKKGWETFTDAIVHAIAAHKSPVVFLLWGRSAQEKCRFLINDVPRGTLLLTAPHPSPLSAHSGFFGCRHFSKANAFLEKHGETPINWARK